ncbi:DUF3618 domain-containing protein [Bradyrhizobium elkanii]|uniref:ElaB/YqjD/DUF883 family membrane-anchored ribosome-binding protein n=1 Tax=Bradyrhizobium elkanii TaxID=29448 RepID=A0A8I1Y7K6_BRAEL|nr:DUF3618 domain-containing protein [Bradyrhizobium elkanii]MBP1294237.1 ElaB/YqjD/DUF883 family membrane-anchored ribosome-binding protein [Bradyrhizobium elkanii]
MTRSVEELRRESERSRAELAATVDRLKDSITGTAEDIRHAVSPEHIKSEVSDFVGRTTQTWISDLKDKALENPIHTFAAGAAVVLPLMRLARGVPLPLLMIGAGLALTSKSVRARVQDAVDPLKDQAGQVLDRSRIAAQELQDNVQQTASSVRGGVAELADAAAGAAGGLKDKATQTFDTLAGKASEGTEAARDAFERLRSGAKDTVDAARDTAQQAPAKAREVIGDNAALIGGLGIAIGAIIAAALPPTEAETKVMGQASGNVRQAATDATASGFEAAKDAALSAADAVASSVADADLGKHASRMTEGVAERLKEAVGGVVAAAFDPNRNSNT